MTKRKPDASRPFGEIPTGFEPLGEGTHELASVFGDLPRADLALLHELKVKEPELMAWLTADPRRAALLQSDPKTAIEDLLLHLKMGARELKEIELPAGWSLEPVKVRETADVGTANLLGAVWTHLNASAANLSAFTNDPFATVRAVATSTGATAQQHDTVVNALSTVLGRTPPQPEDVAGLHRHTQLVAELRSTPGAVFLRRA